MERPKITKEMVLKASQKIAKNLGVDPKIIATNYWHPMDGHELAKKIERYEGADFSIDEVEELDNLRFIVTRMQDKAEKKWAEENKIQPALSTGTQIKQGVIHGVCSHSAARYLVKEKGCTQPHRFLLVNFEDAAPNLDQSTEKK